MDGCHIPFLEKPRGIPEGKDAKDMLNGKGLYSINAQIIGGFDRRIYDILLTAPGSPYDAAVWNMSLGKGWLETRFAQRFILGDSAYSLTKVKMTPYSEDQSRYNTNI